MAKTVSNLTILDPAATIVPGAPVQENHYQHSLEGLNWEYSKLRRPIIAYDFAVGGAYTAERALMQGSGSAVDTTINTKTERFRFFYKARAVPDDLAVVKAAILAERETANGTVDIEFTARGGTSATAIDSISFTVSDTSPTQYTGMVAGGSSTLQGGVTYLVRVYLTTGNDPAASVSVYRLAVWEEAIALGDMPTGP